MYAMHYGYENRHFDKHGDVCRVIQNKVVTWWLVRWTLYKLPQGVAAGSPLVGSTLRYGICRYENTPGIVCRKSPI